MARHEGMEPKMLKEHPRKGMPPHKMARKDGGRMDEKEEPEDEDQDEEAKAENHEAGPKESPGRKDGGKVHRQKRKAGGAVHGEKPKHRPDKRARGGATGADLHPETAAGHMTAPSFERVGPKPDGGGEGKDRD